MFERSSCGEQRSDPANKSTNIFIVHKPQLYVRYRRCHGTLEELRGGLMGVVELFLRRSHSRRYVGRVRSSQERPKNEPTAENFLKARCLCTHSGECGDNFVCTHSFYTLWPLWLRTMRICKLLLVVNDVVENHVYM